MDVLQKYQSHKTVRAAQIHVVIEARGGYFLTLDLITDGLPAGVFVAEEKLRNRPRPVVGGYLVLYDDGHFSFSPKEAFEMGYRLMEHPERG